ncbi:hypothetical protein [Paenibacillus sp. BIC5C1]|uniref:hypothetical protein n=1 Tax=Paenibacillus sp. BIC5C1 TaxID=3078263 RepID=UPI0028E8D4F5|nr:hypothetical protein [Paenibacillus sp. BIC5C1]
MSERLFQKGELPIKNILSKPKTVMSKQEEIKQALAAATPGPWAIYKTTVGKCEETLIGTAYDHPQLKAPDNIVGHACGLGGEFVYIRDNDANLIAKAPEYIAYLLETLEEVLLDRDIAKQNRKQWEKCYDAAEEKSDRLRKELEEAQQETKHMTTLLDDDTTSALTELHEYYSRRYAAERDAAQEAAHKLQQELEEARKIKFPRQPDGEGGWTIDYGFLDKLDTRVYKESDYSADLEDLETMLLALEKVLGQEGEGNQRTVEVTLSNEGYKEHQLKFEEQGEIEVENKLTLWYNIEKRDAIIESVKANIQKRYGFSDGEFVSIGGGFKFLFDDETNGEIEITFIEVNGNLKVTVKGSWPWEVIEIYNHCLPQSAEEDPA